MSVRFDGASDRLASDGVSGSVVTITMWLYRSVDRNASSNSLTLLGGASPELGIGSNAGGDFVTAYDSAFVDFGNLIFAPVGGWIRFAVVANGTSWTVYSGDATGALSSTTGTRVAISSPDVLHLSHATDWWNGRISNLKIFERALSASEVAAELLSWTPINSANLVRSHYFWTDVSKHPSSSGSVLTAGGTAVSFEADPPELSALLTVAGAAPRARGALTGAPGTSGALAGSTPMARGALVARRGAAPIDNVAVAVRARAGTPVKTAGPSAGTPRVPV